MKKIIMSLVAIMLFVIGMASCGSHHSHTSYTTTTQGYEQSTSEWRRCTVCDGKGTCTACKGTGKISGDNCRACKGKGKCNTCQGNGGYYINN